MKQILMKNLKDFPIEEKNQIQVKIENLEEIKPYIEEMSENLMNKQIK